MTPRHALMAVALAVAGWFAFFGDKTPSGDIAAPVAPRATAAATPATPTRTTPARSEREPVLLALLPREALIGNGAVEAPPDALFNSQSWTPPPPAPAAVRAAVAPAPRAPPLPYAFIGRKREDNVWEVYLARGENTFIARAHGVLEGVWRVDAITAQAILFTYLPLKKSQRLTIEGTD